ncbi:MAG: PCP reductase family protein, partial [Gemmatimonadetes bacterium]|nr:PCP reductase family protein [Gemmatimonadota bacterium]
FVRSKMVGRDDAFVEEQSAISSQHSARAEADTEPLQRPRWSVDAQARLERVPGFVRGMVKKIYADYAVERRIGEITPAVMDRARAELGLEGM